MPWRSASPSISLVGDLDSVSAAGAAAAEAPGTAIERHPPDKDATDTELAIDAARRGGMRPVIGVSATGGDDAPRPRAGWPARLRLAGPGARPGRAVVGAAARRRSARSGGLDLRDRPGRLVSLMPRSRSGVRRIVTDRPRLPARTRRRSRRDEPRHQQRRRRRCPVAVAGVDASAPSSSSATPEPPEDPPMTADPTRSTPLLTRPLAPRPPCARRWSALRAATTWRPERRQAHAARLRLVRCPAGRSRRSRRRPASRSRWPRAATRARS